MGPLRAITHRLPPLPRMAGIVRRLARVLPTPDGLVQSEVLGSRMELDPSELVDSQLLYTPQLFDRPERRFLAAHLRPGDTFLDLGAYLGFYALWAERLVGPQGRVLAVEPEPTSVAQLQRHLQLNHSQVELAEVALSDTAGQATMAVRQDGNRGASSLLGTRGRCVSVPTTTLVDLLAQRGIEHVAAAKLDLEGMEYRVLRHYFAHTPEHRWPRALVVEHHPVLVAPAGGDTLSLLRQARYELRPASRHNHLATRC